MSHRPLNINSKGMYVWYIPDCNGGNYDSIIDECLHAGFGHLAIKIADNIYPFGIVDGQDMPAILIAKLRQKAPMIEVIGWHYVKGDNPEGEAQVAVDRCIQLGVDAYAIDAEGEYKQPGKKTAATTFMNRIRPALDMPVGLASYRFPSQHREFPWLEFRSQCDFDMPQVYWQDAHNPDVQLETSWTEFSLMAPSMPYFPTGSAYKAGTWVPTPEDITKFMQKAISMGLPAVNFWEWGRTKKYAPELWPFITTFPWPEEVVTLPKAVRVKVLNNLPVRAKPNEGKIVGVALYNWKLIPNAVDFDANGKVWYRIDPGWVPASGVSNVEV